MENKELIKNAVKYIDKCGISKVTIEDVAQNAGFSIDYFNRIFRNHTGFNVMEYARFRRLNRAARMLRLLPQTDILSIALECGYESHEGFIRAFKEQYGKTPSEYRENMKDKPFIWADHELNATAVAEFRHVLPNFAEKDPDEVIDWLLEKDAKRYGYTAVTIANNGSKIVSDCDSLENGFIMIDNFYDKPHFYLVIKDTDDLRKYMEKLLHLSPETIYCVFHTDVSLEDVKAALADVQYKELKMNPETMYFGEPFVLPPESGKYDIHYLEERDLEAVETFIDGRSDEIFKRSGGFGLKNLLKTPLSQRLLSRPMGVFQDGRLLAVTYDAPQSTHGFCLNNCVHTAKLPSTPNDAIQYLYLAGTNSVMERGYIPFEDAQFGEYAKEHGEFDAFELGFKQVNTVFRIHF